MSRDAGKCSFLINFVKRRKSSRSLSKKHPVHNGLFTPIERQEQKGKRTFSGILKKGSMTVETALAVPIFMMAVICIASLMGIYAGTLRKMTALRDTCEQTALAASAVEDEMWIDFSAPQEFKPYFLPAGVFTGMVMCRGRVRCWNGRESGSQGETGEADSASYVYLSEHASVYHTSSKCTYLNLSIQAISKEVIFLQRSSDGSKYKKCELCVGEKGAADMVYITEDGEKYHNTTACSGLKRTVKMVERSEIDLLKECSRCASHTQS